MTETKYLTILDATAVLSLSRTAVYQLIAAGKLRTVKFGRAVRIHSEELERFISETAISGGTALTER